MSATSRRTQAAVGAAKPRPPWRRIAGILAIVTTLTGAAITPAIAATSPVLTVTVSGDGTVTSADGTISCPSTCTTSYKPGSTATLTATPAKGGLLQDWGGDCSGTAGCTVTMDGDHNVSATFAPATYDLTVKVLGSGSVTSSGGSIKCTDSCTIPEPNGATVTLDTNAAQGSAFARYAGDCTKSPCTITMDSAKTVWAAFMTDMSGLDISSVFADGGGTGAFRVNIPILTDAHAPTAVLVAPATLKSGGMVVLDASRSKDADGALAGYRWDLDGDGLYDDAFGARVTYRAGAAGPHRVSVQVADRPGRIGQASRSIRVFGTSLTNVPRLLSGAAPAALTGGFSSLRGWHNTGNAFAVTRTQTLTAARVLGTDGRLGGTYANGIGVRAGSSGAWVSSYRPTKGRGLTAASTGELAVGRLASAPFKLTKSYLKISLGAGGVFGKGEEQAQLWVQGAKGWRPVRTAIAAAGEAMRPVAWSVGTLRGQLASVVITDASTTGHVNVDSVGATDRIPSIAGDRQYYRLPPERRTRLAHPAPIVGFADYHAHPEGPQGFGALQGIRPYMGDVGSSVDDYVIHPGRYVRDVYGEDTTHFGGPLGRFGVDVANHAVKQDNTLEALSSLIVSHVHPRYGGPCPDGAPASAYCDADHHEPGTIGPANEQLNVFELHRDWQGGMRLLSSLAVNSTVLEYLGGHPKNRDGGPPEADIAGAPTETGTTSNNHVDTTPEADVIRAQVEGMKQLAADNSTWMAIAYNPQQAYDIMANGKLAIVLGTEIDTTGSLGFASAEAEVDWLWRLGIRQVTPIHCCDSKIGGSALFQDAYNMSNDFLNRPTRDVTANRVTSDINTYGTHLDPKPGHSAAEAREGYLLGAVPGCLDPTDRGECIRWRFDTPSGEETAISPKGHQQVADIDGTVATSAPPYFVGPTIHPAPRDVPDDEYATYNSVPGGMRNPQGLTDYGRSYIEALMSHGMLIDMEHMSEATISDLTAPATPEHAAGPLWHYNPARSCGVRETYNSPRTPDDCWQYAYPLMSSHTSFRAQSMLPGQTTFKGFLSREFERTPDQIEYVRRSGGVLGPVISQDPVNHISETVPGASGPTWKLDTRRDWRTTSNVPDNCAGSSSSWWQAYLYGVQKMGGRGVGLSDDMLLVGGPLPRFGGPGSSSQPGACAAYYQAKDDQAELHANPAQYNASAQIHRLSYGSPFTYLPGRPNPLRMEVDPGGVAIDFNTRGGPRLGQLPDMLQDVSNNGATAHDLAPLFNSAQSYVDMWSKAYAVADCYSRYAECGGTPAPLTAAQVQAVCRNTCPNDPGRGLGRAPDGSPYLLKMPDGNYSIDTRSR